MDTWILSSADEYLTYCVTSFVDIREIFTRCRSKEGSADEKGDGEKVIGNPPPLPPHTPAFARQP